jgi:hypothetical protein
MPASGSPYAPEPGTPAHFLIGQLIGAIRYVKARKRHQPLTSWRFASAQAHTVIRLFFERSRGWCETAPRLSTSQHIQSDASLTKEDREAVLSTLDFSTPERMDDNFVTLLRHTLSLGREKPSALSDTIPDGPVCRLGSFVETELGAAGTLRVATNRRAALR